MKLRIKQSVFYTIAIILGGCTSHLPHPKPSDLNQAPVTRSGVKVLPHDQKRGNDNLSQIKWWTKLGDPVLNQLIHDALAKNYAIKNAKANLIQARAKLQEAHAAWIPTLNYSANGFTGGGWDSQVKPQGPLALTPALSKINTIHFRGYYTGFVPNYSVNFLENIHNDRFAKASLDVQCANYQSTRLTIIGQISGSYFMLLGQKQQLHQQSETIHDLKTLRHLEWIRYRDGASDLSAVVNLDKQIANNEANRRATQNSIAEVENAIQLLLNHNPAPITTNRSIDHLSVKHLIPAYLPSTVLKNRPDIMISEGNLRMTEANLGLAYSNFFPKINLTGLLGLASFELSHLLSVGTNLWIAEAAASIPVLNGVSYAQIKEAKAGYFAAYYSHLQTIKSAFSDVDNSLTNQQKLNEAYHDQARALRASKKAYALAVSRYQAGNKDYRDVINAKLDLDAAAIDLTRAKMDQLDSIVTVYQSLAGGYMTNN